jgi:hypothetical protein
MALYVLRIHHHSIRQKLMCQYKFSVSRVKFTKYSNHFQWQPVPQPATLTGCMSSKSRMNREVQVRF